MQLAQEYLKVQTEIAYLSRHMDQLAERLSEAEGLSQLDQLDSERLEEELRKLENEKVGRVSVVPVILSVFNWRTWFYPLLGKPSSTSPQLEKATGADPETAKFGGDGRGLGGLAPPGPC